MRRDILKKSILPITLASLFVCGAKLQNANASKVNQNSNQSNQLVQTLETPKNQKQSSQNPVINQPTKPATHTYHNYHFNYTNTNHYLNWVRNYNSSHKIKWSSNRLNAISNYVSHRYHHGTEVGNLYNYAINAKYINPRYYSSHQLYNYLDWAYKYNSTHAIHINDYHMNNIRNYINDGYSNSLNIIHLLNKVDNVRMRRHYYRRGSEATHYSSYNVQPALNYLYWTRWFDKAYNKQWSSYKLTKYSRQIKANYSKSSYPYRLLEQVLHFKPVYHHKHYIRRHTQNPDVVNNTDYDFYTNYTLDDINVDNHAKTLKSFEGNSKVRFSKPMYLHYTRLGLYNYGYRYGDPQSMLITPNGRMDVLFNVTHSGKGFNINRILQYDTRGKLLKVGSQFRAGHGQGLTYDYQNNTIWYCKNNYGSHKGMIPKDLIIQKLNPNTLRPTRKKKYISANSVLGENVAMSKHNLFNVVRSYFGHNYAPYGSLRIYQMPLGNSRLHFVRSILHSPGAIIQNLEFNPLNNKLYVVCNGSLMSFPANDLLHLTNHDIHVARFPHNEFESLGFYKHQMYLLLNHPSRILVSNTIL